MAAAITVLDTTNPSTKAKDINPESGSAIVIANSIAGGFLDNGPTTATANIVSATITGNGATSGGVAYPTFLIDPVPEHHGDKRQRPRPGDPGRGALFH